MVKKHIFALSLIVIIVAVGIFALSYDRQTAIAQTATGGPLHGWAWSSNTGWISFNSTDPEASSPNAYSVIADSSGNLSGYAWSSNIGWIKFGGLSQFPSSGGTSPRDASINLVSGALNGWVRACAGTALHPTDLTGDCSTMLSRTDGWDGWISLAGLNYTSPDASGSGGTSAKGVTMRILDGVFSGFAWGSTNNGWLGFYPTVALQSHAVACPTCGTGGGNSAANSCAARIYPGGSIAVGPAPLNIPAGGADVVFLANPGNQIDVNSYAWDQDSESPDQYNDGSEFNYAWGSGSPGYFNRYPNDAGTSIHYTATGAGPALLIRDNGTFSNPIVCPTVTTPVAPQSTLKLFIGKTTAALASLDGSSTGHDTLQVKKGDPFALKWVNGLPATYECDTIISNNGGTYWSSFWNPTVVSSQTSVGGISTSNASTGVYHFTLSCVDSSELGPNQSSSIDLIITNSTIIEI